MKCPGCGEINDAGMQFCIFCGQGLLAAPPPAPPPVTAGMPPTEEQQRMLVGSTSQLMVLVCTACNKTDPLNAQFCVYCGGRCIPSPLAMQPGRQSFSSIPSFSSTSVPAYPSGTMPGYQSGSQIPSHPPQPVQDTALSQEFVRSAPQVGPGSGRGLGILAIILALILGAGGSIGVIYYMKEDVQKSALSSSWPSEGLLILSNVPNGEFRIDDSKKKAIIFGRLSPRGNLHLPSISQGAYTLTISDGNGKEYKSEVSVNQGGSNVIGYPKRIDVK